MRRRSVLRAVATASVLGVAGCTAMRGGDDATPVTVQAVDVLNRRSAAATAEFVAERGEEVAVRRTVEVAGTENASRPPAVEIAAFADDPGVYRFRLDVRDGETLETTPSGLNVTADGADCVRVVFVLNLDDRLTAYARSPCASE